MQEWDAMSGGYVEIYREFRHRFQKHVTTLQMKVNKCAKFHVTSSMNSLAFDEVVPGDGKRANWLTHPVET